MGNVKTSTDIDVKVGTRVRQLRMAAKMTQEDLGEKLGISFQQIQKYEKGKNRIGAGRLWKISEIFSVPIEELFVGCHRKKRKQYRPDPKALALNETAFGNKIALALSKIDDEAVKRSILKLTRSMEGLQKSESE